MGQDSSFEKARLPGANRLQKVLPRNTVLHKNSLNCGKRGGGREVDLNFSRAQKLTGGLTNAKTGIPQPPP